MSSASWRLTAGVCFSNLANKSVANFEHFKTVDELPAYGSLTVSGSIIMFREVGWAGGGGGR